MMVNTQASDLVISMKNCRLSEEGRSEIMTRVCCSSPISILTDELLIEILCRLGSPKHAAQCKLVSKLWHSLINTDSRSSYFMRQWHRTEEEDELPQILLAWHQGVKEQDCRHVTSYKELPSFKSLNFLPEKDQILLLGTYEDLVLCEPDREGDAAYYVCNPFTKQYTALPPLRPPSESNYLYAAALYFYDPEDYTFKVIDITHDLNTELTRVEIFSSEDNAWTEMDCTGHENWINMIPASDYQYVIYHGMIVWLVDDFSNLIGIKIDQEHDGCCTSLIPLPSNNPDSRMQMVSSGEHIRLAAYEFENLKLKIWELDEEDDETWKLVHDLGLGDMEDSEDCSKLQSCLQRCKTEVLSFHPNDEDVLYLSCRPLDEDEDESMDESGDEEDDYEDEDNDLSGDEDEDNDQSGNEDEDNDQSGDEDESHVFLCDLRNRTVRRLPSVVDGFCHISMPGWPSPVPLLPPSS